MRAQGDHDTNSRLVQQLASDELMVLPTYD